jgi:hypothetical protein
MQGREFLVPARALANRVSEADRRMAITSAYYALFLECREILRRWGCPPFSRFGAHAAVRLKMAYAKNAELQSIGDALDNLIRLRNRACYDLAPHPDFASATKANNSITQSANALALLDAIESDPQRRAAAIASLPP